MSRKRNGKYTRQTHMPIPLLILVDAVLAGMILLCFALFHHVFPAWVSEYERLQAQQESTQAPDREPSTPQTNPVTESPTQGVLETEALQQTEPTAAPTEAPTEPDNRTPWQIKFQDRFTDDVVITENSYSSPEVSVTIETITTGEGNAKVTYHVADVYVASMDNFVTHTANGEMRYFGTQDVLEMNEAANAILSLSGDFLTYQKGGFLMRNGEIYTRESNLVSICVLYQDGTMQTYPERTYQIDDIIQKGAVQVWSFGPVLLDENGKAMDWYKNVSSAVSYPNPRSAIGYYEPGHYCFVLVDGRQNGYSRGMELPELGRVFEELGCKAAYNLDGGGSAVMVYNQQRYSKPSNGGRDLGDILVIRDSYYTPPKAEEAVQ